MLTPLDLFSSTTQCPLRVEDDVLCLHGGQAAALNRVGVGNHTYLTIESGSGRAEVVRYHHTEDIAPRGGRQVCLPVERDVLNSGRYAFASGTPVRFEWVEPAVAEFYQQMED